MFEWTLITLGNTPLKQVKHTLAGVYFFFSKVIRLFIRRQIAYEKFKIVILIKLIFPYNLCWIAWNGNADFYFSFISFYIFFLWNVWGRLFRYVDKLNNEKTRLTNLFFKKNPETCIQKKMFIFLLWYVSNTKYCSH